MFTLTLILVNRSFSESNAKCNTSYSTKNFLKHPDSNLDKIANIGCIFTAIEYVSIYTSLQIDAFVNNSTVDKCFFKTKIPYGVQTVP